MCYCRPGVFKSWGYSGSHALELLEKSSDVLRDRLFRLRFVLAKLRREITVDHSAADLGKKMGTAWCPAHLLAACTSAGSEPG
jgi:hypothetical protein